MIIPKNTIKKWKSYLDHGDIGKISEESNISRQTISLALNEGIANSDTVSAIQSFVDKKKLILK